MQPTSRFLTAEDISIADRVELASVIAADHGQLRHLRTVQYARWLRPTHEDDGQGLLCGAMPEAPAQDARADTLCGRCTDLLLMLPTRLRTVAALLDVSDAEGLRAAQVVSADASDLTGTEQLRLAHRLVNAGVIVVNGHDVAYAADPLTFVAAAMATP